MNAFSIKSCLAIICWTPYVGLAISLPAALRKSESPAGPKPAAGTSAMVSSAHPIATEAGLEILKKGGNAFDAAFCSLIRLGMMSVFDVKAMGHNSLEMLHRFCEVTKHAFGSRIMPPGTGIRLNNSLADCMFEPKGSQKAINGTLDWKTTLASLNVISLK